MAVGRTFAVSLVGNLAGVTLGVAAVGECSIGQEAGKTVVGINRAVSERKTTLSKQTNSIGSGAHGQHAAAAADAVNSPTRLICRRRSRLVASIALFY